MLQMATINLLQMEDGTVSHVGNAYSLRQGRRLAPTLEVKELQFVIVVVM
jgi:hypothetical protein